MAELTRVFTARTIAILTVGSVIGSGIFLVPSEVLKYAGGSLGVATAIWIFGGLLTFLGALTYGELGAMNPGAGGLYLYIKDGFGRAVAFAYGWTLFLVIASGTVAALAVAATRYLGEWIEMAPGVQSLVAAALALGVAIINVFGTGRSATILKVGTVLKIAAIVLLVLALPILGDGLRQMDQVARPAITASMLGSAGLGLVASLWAYEGWQYLTFLGGETIEPQRNLPRGLAFGTLALVAIYVAAATAYVAGIGPAAVMASDRVAADAANATLGVPWGKILTIPIILSMLTAAQANAMMSARVYYAMAKDGVFFEPMGRLHSRYGTPATALTAGAIMAAVLAWFGIFEVLLQYVVFVGWAFYALGGLALIVLRQRQPHAARPYRVPGYPLTPLLFVLSGFAIVVNTVVQDPAKGVIGLGASVLAIPVFYLWQALRVR